MKYYKIFLILIILAGITTQGYSQCAQLTKAIKKAESLYDNGDLIEAAHLLDSMARKMARTGCPTEMKRARVLLTRTYLFMNKDSSAEESYKVVLLIDPMYQPDSTLEPVDLIYFAEKYQTVPRWSITGEGILGQPNIFLHDIYNITMTNETFGSQAGDNSAYGTIYGYGIGVRGSYYLNRWLELSGGVQFQTRRYEITKNIKGVEFTNNTPPTNDLFITEELDLKEQQEWLNFPLMLKINFSTKNFVPTLYVGGEYASIFNARLPEARRGGFSLDAINVDGLRNQHQIGLLAGIGINYRPSKVTKNYLTLNVQYTGYATRLNDAKSRYNNPRLLYVLGYIDDDISMGYLQFTLGYTFADYRTLKKKKTIKR